MPIERELLKKVILEQRAIPMPTDYVERQINSVITPLLHGSSIIIITGVRRCGKSVVLKNIRKSMQESDYYLNFDDDRLVNFTVEDFQMLYEIFVEMFGEQKTFYFDEIQNILEWERFVRRLHEHGNKVFITGSNASMLSVELGTRLTGRNISVSMYPYSFYEFVSYKNSGLLQRIIKNNLTTTTVDTGLFAGLFNEYMQVGGIPEYVKDQQDDYISSLYENILYKDIIVRHKLTKVQELKQLGFFAASNVGKKITLNSVRKMLNLGNASTVSEYYGYFEQSFLTFLVNEHHDSVKKQLRNKKKQYFIDQGMARIVGFRTSEDYGRLLENIVFIELKRRKQEIYVYQGQYECDFIIVDKNKVKSAIQVCKNLDDIDTKTREYNGILEAMNTHKLDRGLILTENVQKTENIVIENSKNNLTIEIMPVWKWLLDPNY
ncbi:MAG TPA: ATP-binding protein [Gammaproteobacteria bacterium]|nr:ATP-binding protein [Gammaproteobacteria bacterium]